MPAEPIFLDTVGWIALLNAADVLHAVADKTWGLVDCVSFVVMRDEGISSAFTNDRHFQQGGFRCLLPMP